jgi:hypothetical protein
MALGGLQRGGQERSSWAKKAARKTKRAAAGRKKRGRTTRLRAPHKCGEEFIIRNPSLQEGLNRPE